MLVLVGHKTKLHSYIPPADTILLPTLFLSPQCFCYHLVYVLHLLLVNSQKSSMFARICIYLQQRWGIEG